MSREPFFGNWMVAIAEAAEVAGAPDLERATVAQLRRAWDLVASAAGMLREELVEQVARQAGLPVADLSDPEPLAAKVIPTEVAWRRLSMPLRVTDRTLVVATSDVISRDAARELASVAGRDVSLEVAHPADLETALMASYGAEAERRPGPPPPPGEELRPHGPHVLVVDDEAGTRILFRSILDTAGYRVTVAPDGPQAIAALESGDVFDLVTLDYWMDKMNGLRVLQHMRSHPKLGAVPVIMITGAEDRSIEMSLFEAGADDVVMKPVDPPLLLLRVQAVLRRRLMA